MNGPTLAWVLVVCETIAVLALAAGLLGVGAASGAISLGLIVLVATPYAVLGAAALRLRDRARRVAGFGLATVLVALLGLVLAA